MSLDTTRSRLRLSASQTRTSIRLIFSSVKVYYAFGFLTLTFVVTALVCYRSKKNPRPAPCIKKIDTTAPASAQTTATVTVLYTYFSLCAEDYRWHWRAFMTGGGSAFWLFLYGLFYWGTRLELEGFSNRILYMGYLSLLSVLNFLLFGELRCQRLMTQRSIAIEMAPLNLAGTIGWGASYIAIRSMYRSVRVD